MKFLWVLLLFVGCTSENEKQVRSSLIERMKLSEAVIEIDKIELGDKVVASGDQIQAMALFGWKDVSTFPLTVTFKAKEDCVPVAEPLKDDHLFNEKIVSCRKIVDNKPNLKYVKAYEIGAWGRRIPVHAESKVIKAGETFKASGELVHTTIIGKNEKKEITYFRSMN